VIKLNGTGFMNSAGKRVTPALSLLTRKANMMEATDFFASYLNLLTGRGSGTGWDRGEESVAANVIRNSKADSPTVIDCGANRGNWTREVRHRLGTGKGTWIALEPNSGCLPYLQTVPNLEVIRAAAGEFIGVTTLYKSDGTSELASLHRREDSYATSLALEVESESVPMVTLDSVIAQRALARVDFLKMDLEGHELFALRGAADSLRSGRIRALSFEFGSGNVNSRTFFRDFWQLLTPLHYSISRICPGGALVPVRDYYETLEYFRGVSNYVAILN